MKSKTQVMKNKDSEKKTVGNGTNKEDNSVFASCTFSSLGLHPTLCDQLHGTFSLNPISLFREFGVLSLNSTHNEASILQVFDFFFFWILLMYYSIVCLNRKNGF